jgi:hypothetical protein
MDNKITEEFRTVRMLLNQKKPGMKLRTRTLINRLDLGNYKQAKMTIRHLWTQYQKDVPKDKW